MKQFLIILEIYIISVDLHLNKVDDYPLQVPFPPYALHPEIESLVEILNFH